jgi:hypothetical protein
MIAGFNRKIQSYECFKIIFEWMPTTLADLSKLSGNILEFCRGMSIRKIEKVKQDGVTDKKGN